MRVLSVLFSLLCVSGVSAQFALLSTSSNSVGAGYTFNTTTGFNPTLTLNAGNTYTFDVSAVTALSPPHPFTFSSAQASVAALDATVFNYTVGAACTLTSGGYLGAGCILTLAVNATATNQTIYYKCTYHPSMVGSVNIVAVAANTTGNTTTPTTVAPTTATPTTAAPTNSSGNVTTVAPTTAAPTTVAPATPAPTTLVTGGTIVSNAFHITGNANTTGYIFTHNGVQYLNPTLNVTANMDVTISFEFANSKFHPFGFSLNPTTNLTAAQLATTDIFSTDVAKLYQITTPASCNTTYFPTVPTVFQNSTDFCVIKVAAAFVTVGPTNIYYRCAKHPGMIGLINVVAAAPTVSSSTGGSTGGSTVAPTQKPSSSTGGNSASTITLSGLTMVFALIVAMLA